MNTFRLTAAMAVAAILAVPLVSFFSAMLIVPLLACFACAAVTNFGPFVLAVLAGLRLFGRSPRLDWFFEAWTICTILWIGAAYGLAHWGDAGSSMGAKNIPYLKVLFAPYLLMAGVPVE
ncbi:hypothetical protein FHS78_001243 [Parvibaculum indicum]|uniref:hypothetical protein n=1 Tax=Parvibaculum indicum TaxID=562969 RepID=UPI00141E32A5|nr:hypothetical protein [Parvibaculum indicum]NIJ40962.1 hypothetical protein [Parvibaculum indicum]